MFEPLGTTQFLGLNILTCGILWHPVRQAASDRIAECAVPRKLLSFGRSFIAISLSGSGLVATFMTWLGRSLRQRL